GGFVMQHRASIARDLRSGVSAGSGDPRRTESRQHREVLSDAKMRSECFGKQVAMPFGRLAGFVGRGRSLTLRVEFWRYGPGKNVSTQRVKPRKGRFCRARNAEVSQIADFRLQRQMKEGDMADRPGWR